MGHSYGSKPKSTHGVAEDCEVPINGGYIAALVDDILCDGWNNGLATWLRVHSYYPCVARYLRHGMDIRIRAKVQTVIDE